MMDRKARKLALRALRASERLKARAALPLEAAELWKMFDWLDVQLPQQPCDHTLRMTIEWLAERGHEIEAVLPWLREHGGYCDCEVLFNVEEHFDDALHDLPREGDESTGHRRAPGSRKTGPPDG